MWWCAVRFTRWRVSDTICSPRLLREESMAHLPRQRGTEASTVPMVRTVLLYSTKPSKTNGFRSMLFSYAYYKGLLRRAQHIRCINHRRSPSNAFMYFLFVFCNYKRLLRRAQHNILRCTNRRPPIKCFYVFFFLFFLQFANERYAFCMMKAIK
jgi:hypothetical protein